MHLALRLNLEPDMVENKSMATRSRTTFQKRQKEMARAEKQREKAAKRLQRKETPRGEQVEMTLEEASILRSS